MESLHKLELTVAGWYKDLPHLPESGRKVLATNVWWLVLVGVVLGALALSGLFMTIMVTSFVLIGFGGAVGAAAGVVAFLGTLVFFALAVIDIVIAAMAVSPLKQMQKRGWRLLFIITLLNVVSVIVSFLSHFDVFGLLWSLLVTAVGAYFLYEVRDYFQGADGVKVGATRVKDGSHDSKAKG